MLYRAIGADGVSRLGYAASSDGKHFEKKSSKPAFSFSLVTKPGASPTLSIAHLLGTSGGSWAGCEDPRMVAIGDRIYLTFLAFNGWSSARVALTSIALDDFLKRRWKWKKPVMISPPWEVNKNWVLFPEKIKGKFAILHSISPKILIDYFDSFDTFNEKHFIHSTYHKSGRKGSWDSWIRGAGPPPIKTKYGWLLLYHAMDARDPGRYKLGAMLLDLKNPTKILHRSNEPILEPDAIYENNGFKGGVIYSCGAVVAGATLYVYYGAADSVVCVATANLQKLLDDLIAEKKPHLTPVRL